MKDAVNLFLWIITASIGFNIIEKLFSSDNKEEELEELRKINQSLEDIKDKVEYININLDEVKYDVSRMNSTVEDINIDIKNSIED